MDQRGAGAHPSPTRGGAASATRHPDCSPNYNSAHAMPFVYGSRNSGAAGTPNRGMLGHPPMQTIRDNGDRYQLINVRRPLYMPPDSSQLNVHGPIYMPPHSHQLNVRGPLYRPPNSSQLNVRGPLCMPPYSSQHNVRGPLFLPPYSNQLNVRGPICMPAYSSQHNVRGPLYMPPFNTGGQLSMPALPVPVPEIAHGSPTSVEEEAFEIIDEHWIIPDGLGEIVHEEVFVEEEPAGGVLSEDFILKNLKTTLNAKQPSPSSHLDQPPQPEICVICQMEFKEDETMATLACNHAYHIDCIKQWLGVKNMCPVCKRPAFGGR